MLDAFRDDVAAHPLWDCSPANGCACRVRTPENGFPIGDEVPLGVLRARGRAKRCDGSEARLEHRMHGFERSCHALEHGNPSIRFHCTEPLDDIFAVEPVKQHGEEGLQVENPGHEVLSTQIHHSLIELRFTRFRTETRGTESHDLRTAPAVYLVDLLVEPCDTEIIDISIFLVKSRTMWSAVLNAANSR